MGRRGRKADKGGKRGREGREGLRDRKTRAIMHRPNQTQASGAAKQPKKSDNEGGEGIRQEAVPSQESKDSKPKPRQHQTQAVRNQTEFGQASNHPPHRFM